jgi:polyhydroxybutyrate depolymerase
MQNRIDERLKESRLTVFIIVLAGIALLSFRADRGKGQRRSIMHDNLKRTFSVYAPASFDKNVQMPVLIALHGRGTNGKGMMLVTKKGFNRLADKDGFLVVYPDGIERSWNDGRRDAEANDRAHRDNINDVGLISALIDFMIAEYNTDPQRIYVTGISNGAMMAYRLACELSHRIAAIAPVDGNIPYLLADGCSPSEPVSVLAINNVLDPLVPFEGGEIHNHSKKIKLGKVISVKESIEFWVVRNGCLITPIFTEMPDTDPDDGTRVVREEYTHGLKGTEVILYSIKGGGHTWPGGFQYLPERRIGKTSRDINANEIIWQFFKKHSLPTGPVQ